DDSRSAHAARCRRSASRPTAGAIDRSAPGRAAAAVVAEVVRDVSDVGASVHADALPATSPPVVVAAIVVAAGRGRPMTAPRWLPVALTFVATWWPAAVVGMSIVAALFGAWWLWGTQAAAYLAGSWPWLLVVVGAAVILLVFVWWLWW